MKIRIITNNFAQTLSSQSFEQYDSLQLICRRGNQQNPSAYSDTLADLINLTSGQAFPFAIFSAMSDGINTNGKAWLRADPVSLTADHANAYINSNITLTETEVTQIVTQLNQFLAEDGITVFAPTPNRWYLQVESTPEIRCYDPASLQGQDISPYLPYGKEQAFWRKLFTECQMLLYNLNVNQQRRMTAKPTVDGVWFWGEGELPEQQQLAWKHLISDQDWALGFAQYYGLEFTKLESIDSDIVTSIKADTLIILSPNLQADDYYSRLEHYCFKPLISHLRSKAITEAEIHLNDIRVLITPKMLKRWWRR